MRKSVIFFACSGLFASPAAAQVSQSVCDPILASGVRDTNQATSFRYQAKNAQSVLCRSEYSTYNAAANADMNGSFNLIGILEGSPDDQVNASNYREKRSDFCSQNFSNDAMNSYQSSAISTLNVALANVFERCVTNRAAAGGGLYAWVEPGDDLKTFTVRVRKTGEARIRRFYAVTADSAKVPAAISCQPNLTGASETDPVVVSGSRDFACVRSNPNVAVTLIGETESDGTLFINSVVLPGRAATVADLGSRIALLEATESMRSVPKGAVLSFAAETCPAGYSDYRPAYGRFVRGYDPTGQIDPMPNREIGSLQEDSVESHSHGVLVYTRTHRASRDGRGRKTVPRDQDGSKQTQASGNFGEEETRPKNVTLLYCHFDG